MNTSPHDVLLQAVRVLHQRGAHRIQIFPYFYATGHWRCPIIVDGREPYKREHSNGLNYSEAMGWTLPGRGDEEDPIDPELEADCIWAELTSEERDLARVPDPDYVAWYEAMLDELPPGSVPYLFADEPGSPYEEGRVGFSWSRESGEYRGRGTSLPPGDSLNFFLSRSQ